MRKTLSLHKLFWNNIPIDLNDKKLYKASFSAGNTSLANYEMISELPYTPFDMSYNPVNHTMYYVTNGGGNKLYSINLQNGGTTMIGQLGDGYLNLVKNIAINSSGEAYGIYSEDTYEGAGTGILCRINLNDASLTHIGNTGRNASYGWTMAFDRETGELFWPQIGEASDDYGLYKVNTQTGATSLLGKIGAGGVISLGGLFGIESSGVAIQSADATTEVSVFPNPTSGVVNVTAEGIQRVEVMDITGRTVAVSTSQTINISAQPNGIYMLRIVTDSGTTVRKVVKQ